MRELFLWERIQANVTKQLHEQKANQVENKINATNLARCLSRYIIGSYPTVSDAVTIQESYALFLAKLEEAKWHINSLNENFEIEIQTCDLKIPAVIIQEIDHVIYATTRLVQFDQEGYIACFAESGSDAEVETQLAPLHHA